MAEKQTKYIFVTGGVVSGLGKGCLLYTSHCCTTAGRSKRIFTKGVVAGSSICGCATMKAPVGLSSGRAVCVSRWRGLNPDKLRRRCV